MTVFDESLKLRQQINDIEEKLYDIKGKIRYPKTFSFSDEPRGCSGDGNSIDRYITQVEKLETKKLSCEARLIALWINIDADMESCNIPESDRTLMKLRFNHGYSWRKCQDIMKEKEGNKWNENRIFRVYRNVVKKLKYR